MAKGDIPNTNQMSSNNSIGQKNIPTGQMPQWQSMANSGVSYPGSIVRQGLNGPGSNNIFPLSNPFGMNNGMNSPAQFGTMEMPKRIGIDDPGMMNGLSPSDDLMSRYLNQPPQQLSRQPQLAPQLNIPANEMN